MRQFTMDHISTLEMVDAALEGFCDDDIGMEGIIRQVAGGIKDKVILKDLRAALKISGWTGWSVSRMHRGIDALEEAMVNFIDEYIDQFDLKGKEVPSSALDSWLAWDDNRTSSIYLLDKKRFPDVLKSAESGPSWKIFMDAIKTEIHIIFGANEVRDIINKRIKTFEDFKTLFKEACDNCRKLVDVASEDSWAKIPRTLFVGNYLGINGLVAIAGQFRSAIRRAV